MATEDTQPSLTTPPQLHRVPMSPLLADAEHPNENLAEWTSDNDEQLEDWTSDTGGERSVATANVLVCGVTHGIMQ